MSVINHFLISLQKWSPIEYVLNHCPCMYAKKTLWQNQNFARNKKINANE